jgi:hypothetical protein
VRDYGKEGRVVGATSTFFICSLRCTYIEVLANYPGLEVGWIFVSPKHVNVYAKTTLFYRRRRVLQTDIQMVEEMSSHRTDYQSGQ